MSSNNNNNNNNILLPFSTRLPCQTLTLHRVDEVSVFAPDLPPETRVVVVLQVGRTEPRTAFLPITLLLLSRPRSGRTVLPWRFAIAARSAPLHLRSDSEQTAGDTVTSESSVDTHFCHCVWITSGQQLLKDKKKWKNYWDSQRRWISEDNQPHQFLRKYPILG